MSLRPLAIESRNLSKSFGPRRAVAGVDLHVEQGAIYGFLGRNGAGKTTAIRLILGLLRPSAGQVRVFGHDVTTDRIAAARHIGSLVEARATYDKLTGRENLDSARRLLGLPATEIDRVLDIVDLSGAADRRVGQYSLGMRQRLGLARALLGAPGLLILDEPMNGLDPAGIRDMRDVIRQMPERCGATVFLSSHLLSEVEQMVSHIGLMHHGRLLVQGEIGALLTSRRQDLSLRTSNQAQALHLLAEAGFAAAVEDQAILVSLTGNADAAAGIIGRGLVEAGLEVFELSRRRRSLEDLFAEAEANQREMAA
jgi:ABC-2 type transport system ATP-binding protein